MKNYILILTLMVIAFTSKAQVIDTGFHHGAAVKILPIKVQFNDTSKASHLQAVITYDDLDSNASVHWTLMDDQGNVKLEGNNALTKAAYVTWETDHSEPFKFIGALLSLTFIKD